MNRTKKTFLNIFCPLAMALAIAASAHAQSAPLSANIPFNFKVGDTSFSSGKYTIQMLSSEALVIRSADSRNASAIAIANAASAPYPQRSSRLVFKSYGDQFFLSTVEWSGGPYRELLPSKAEIELASFCPETLEARLGVGCGRSPEVMILAGAGF
jgi:hypothetical protein